MRTFTRVTVLASNALQILKDMDEPLHNKVQGKFTVTPVIK
jgi:hypothetical protein